MRDPDDTGTPDLIGFPPRRGRPRTGHAQTDAERQAAYRARIAKKRQQVLVTVDDLEWSIQGLRAIKALPSSATLSRGAVKRLNAALARLEAAAGILRDATSGQAASQTDDQQPTSDPAPAARAPARRRAKS